MLGVQVEDCPVQPSYNYPTETKRIYCRTHKKDGERCQLLLAHERTAVHQEDVHSMLTVQGICGLYRQSNCSSR